MWLSGAVSTVVATVATAAVPALPASASSPVARPAPVIASPATGFGGYHAQADVTEIGARWTVPTVAPGSPSGDAGTWIGAAGPTGLFVQVGTIETKLRGAPARYELFWSDPLVGFQAQLLGAASPGDTIVATMRRAAAGWKLAIDDTTAHEAAARSLAYGRTGRFDEADWFQEDPVPSLVTARDLPYPSLSTVAFSQLSLNGAQPTLRRADGLTLMTSDNGDFVPTPLTNDGFSLQAPTGYAKTYLLDAKAIDRVLSGFLAQLATWSSVPPAQRAATIGRVITSYRRFGARLAAHTWPAAARAPLRWLLRRNAVVTWALHRWLVAGAALSSPAFERFARALDTKATIAMRASLGLPPA